MADSLSLSKRVGHLTDLLGGCVNVNVVQKRQLCLGSFRVVTPKAVGVCEEIPWFGRCLARTIQAIVEASSLLDHLHGLDAC